MASIPSVSLASFFVDEGVVIGDAPTADQSAAAAAIHAACIDHGFVHIYDFGVTPELRSASFAAARGLFALPDEHKRENLSRISPQTNLGYAPFSYEQLNRGRPPDLKEAFNVRNPVVHTNDFRGVSDGFEQTALTLWAAVEKAARRYALACAVALGLDAHYFERTLSRMDLCTLRFLHYPPTDILSTTNGAAAKTETAIRVGEHTDFGAYTFLLLGDGAQGLQMKPVQGGEIGGAAGGEEGGWIDVVAPPAPEGSVGALVNTGACLARWTNDVWRATAHRVIVPNLEVASTDRYSIACFIDPDAKAVVEVDPRFVPEGEEPKYPPTTGLAYLLHKLKEAQGVA